MTDQLSAPSRLASAGRSFHDRPSLKLFVASVLALFAELVLIRWIPSALHAVAFFANLVLVASFLGLGIGMARKIEPSLAAWRALVRLAFLSGVLVTVGLLDPVVDFGSNTDLNLNETSSGFALPGFAVMLGVYLLAAWTMVPFGQLVAAYFDQMRKLNAYSVNIGGSLLGVLAFAFAAALGMSPYVWFGVVVLLVLILDRRIRYILPIAIIGAFLVASHVDDSNGGRSDVLWSPYYKVVTTALSDSQDLDRGFTVDVNNQFLLSGLDLRPDSRPGSEFPPETAARIESLKSYYAFPFALRNADSALILGAGAGNDVAAALRADIASVTAVEIDPLVLQLGEHHPENPYASSRVTSVIDDARSFLRESNRQYDIVLFATLDAHGLLASNTNVRLDSFIYTKQSIESARDHVAPGGLLILSFGPFREDVQLRQYATIRDVFEQEPLFFIHDSGQRAIVAGAIDELDTTVQTDGWRQISEWEIEAGFLQYPYAELHATDDWPFLYLREPTIPREYVWTLVGIILLSVLLVLTNFRRAYRVDGHFLFLGAGFLLLETKSVTEFGLLIGSTWQTNALVFSVILIVILCANLLVMTRLSRPPTRLVYFLIGVALLAQYVLPVSAWTSQPSLVGLIAAALYLGVPIFLAAVVFAGSFKTAVLGTAALASNLIGSVLGGATEYLSLMWGIRSLTLVALAMYAFSWLFWERRSSARAETRPALEAIHA